MTQVIRLPSPTGGTQVELLLQLHASELQTRSPVSLPAKPNNLFRRAECACMYRNLKGIFPAFSVLCYFSSCHAFPIELLSTG